MGRKPISPKRRKWKPAKIVETDGDYYWLRIGKRRYELDRDEFNNLVDNERVILVHLRTQPSREK